MKEFDDAIVLKLSKMDKEYIKKMAQQERLSISAYVRNRMCSGNTGYDGTE